MELTPVDDQIVVTVEGESMRGGLHLPSDVDAYGPKYAKVIAVGPGRPSEYTGSLIPMPVGVRVGRRVLMHGGAGTRYTIAGVEYRWIRRSDIMAFEP